MIPFDFDIRKTVRRSVYVLGLGSVFSLLMAFVCGYRMTNAVVCPIEIESVSRKTAPYVLDLGLGEDSLSFPRPQVQSDVSLYFDPVFPSKAKEKPLQFVLRLKKNGLSKKISLPARIDLFYDKGLNFANAESVFWMDLSKGPSEKVEARVYIADVRGEKQEMESFLVIPETSPLLNSLDFSLNTPLRSFSEARLIGKDAFLAKYGDPKEEKWRLELGQRGSQDILSLRKNDFLVWQNGQWHQELVLQEAKGPVVQLVQADEKMAVFQGWDGDASFRFGISLSPPSPLKIKAEEFFSAVRIRSEKQISCMLDKQCFVLRVGDWILKQDNRWKVLRQKEEKEAYVQGKISGELFVFERIEVRDKQKAICGALFNPERSLLFPVDVLLLSQDKFRNEKRKPR